MDEDKEIFKRAIRRMAAGRFDINGSLETSAEMIADAASSAADALKHVEQSTARSRGRSRGSIRSGTSHAFLFARDHALAALSVDTAPILPELEAAMR